jgi:hypothetical protein
VFFYDGARSQAIAFGGLLNDGESFVRRLMEGFSASSHAQLVHVATDGESYGHHHRYGEMALAWALKTIEERGEARLTNYGQFLEKFPPEYEAEIVEDTSWSCAHGIERWRSNCGCNSGHAGWNQEWRAPLRAALDELRDSVAPLVKARGAELFRDFDAARNAYIDVILDRDKAEVCLAAHASHTLSRAERVAALQLMELERHAMLMYTSCGWFFDEISGIETVQVIAYAGRVLHLAEKLFGKAGEALEAEFIKALEPARSNIASENNGAQIYRQRVQSERVDVQQLAAHYAISSVFTNYGTSTEMFCFTIRRLEHEVVTSGRARLLIGQASVCSNLTEEEKEAAFAVLHFGDQNITAAVKPFEGPPSANDVAAYDEFVRAAKDAVVRADFPAAIRSFDGYFPAPTFSIRSLFRDEQRRIVHHILKSTLSEVEASLASIYENQASLLHFLSQAGLPRPDALNVAATFAIDAGLRRAIESEPIDALQVRTYLKLAEGDQVPLNASRLSYIADQAMKRAMVDLQVGVTEKVDVHAKLDNALLAARTLNELPFELNLWQAQNIWYDVWKQIHHAKRSEPEAWFEGFQALGTLLRILVEEFTIDENPQMVLAEQKL